MKPHREREAQVLSIQIVLLQVTSGSSASRDEMQGTVSVVNQPEASGVKKKHQNLSRQTLPWFGNAEAYASNIIIFTNINAQKPWETPTRNAPSPYEY